MSKYLTKMNLMLIIIIFIGLRFTDFNQTMTSFWVGPVLSAAVNFDWSNFNIYINLDEVYRFSELSENEFWKYNFSDTKDLILYDYLTNGLVILVVLSKKIFFFAGDLEALQYLQYLMHIGISIFTISLFKEKYQKFLFFILYAINPIVLWVVNYPFYYFWQVIPSFIFIYWYLKKDISLGLLSAFSVIFAFIYITRPTVLLLILLFYTFLAFKNSFKKAFFGLVIFFGLVNISSGLSISPYHTMYVGIGAYSNPYNIKLDDEAGYNYYKEQTGNIVNSGNIMQTKIKNDYYKILKEKYIQIIKKNPFMILRNATLNTIQAYSIGYSHNLNQKFANKIIYLSLLIGILVIVLLLYTKQYVIFLALGFASASFTLYYPPILTYMFGNFILLVVGFIGIIDYFIKQREFKNAH